jgi:multiple sugar transport system permease protein
MSASSVSIKRPQFIVSRRTRQRYLTFIILIAPALILRLATAAYPIFRTIQLSFRDISLLYGTDTYVGLENYRQLPTDFGFRSSIDFTILFVVVSTALQLILGLMIAQLLNAEFKGRSLARAVNLIPWAIPTIVAAYAFQWILDDQFGMIPDWVHFLIGKRPVVFISPSGAKAAVILVNVWKNAPFMAVVFLAGLQGVPEELYEAAKVDGANALQRFWSITIPLITPLVITMGTFFVVWQIASFDLIFGLTNGGPGVATSVLALRIFDEGLLYFKYGFASAIAVVLLLIVGLVGLVGIVLFRRFEVTL